ncbi:MAG TPA: bifunctional methylenetetrahydrofolate dehydrogenase/methenyltetrahydrofolate cyclohydrolase FolD [bacterium]|nr:bifunctional methylenetetrahydrofolate dehydrogenase/methenyltetrahydrofolate cyclohydrolase FolD [bacterium]
MAKLIDGRKIAENIRNEVADEVRRLKDRGVNPHLSVVLVGDDPASKVYVRMKGKACQETGIGSETLIFPESLSQDELVRTIRRLNADPKINGILVQSPLPRHLDEHAVIELIDPIKDVDAFHPYNVGKLAAGFTDGYLPCTPVGVQELLLRSGYSPEGKHVVIVGRSNIVGKPLGLILVQKAKGANATVTWCHSRTRDLPEITRSADILVAAIGQAEFITREMVKPGAVVIDVGVNRVPDEASDKGYRIAGDVAFDPVSEIAEAITPVPGGVGPMTIAMLLRNTVLACRRQHGIEKGV